MLSDFTPRSRAFARALLRQGIDPDEIAKRMGISVKTVYSKKHKIQARLEAAVKRAA
jgi:RNA polymerase sigma-70 factor (ECF subfamily)